MKMSKNGSIMYRESKWRYNGKLAIPTPDGMTSWRYVGFNLWKRKW